MEGHRQEEEEPSIGDVVGLNLPLSQGMLLQEGQKERLLSTASDSNVEFTARWCSDVNRQL